MMDVIKQFAVSLTGVVDEQGLARVEKSAEDTALSIKDFATAAIGALTAGAFASAVKETADRFNSLGDAAAQMGNITARELDRIGYVAEHTGSNVETAVEGLHQLTKAMGEADAGSGGGFDAFQQLGISVKNADGSIKSITQVMDDLRVKMKDMSVAQRQAVIQMLGMEKTMIGLFQDDTAEIIAQYDKRTAALGLNADELAEKSTTFNDKLAHMTRAFSDVLSTVVVRILPPITSAFEIVTDWITESGDTILGIITPFTKVLNVMMRMVNGAMVTLGGLIDLFGSMPAYIALAAAAWKAFSMLMTASPLAKAITAISAVASLIGLLIDDFKIARSGGESFFEFWNQPFFDAFLKAGRGVIDFFSGLIDTAANVAKAMAAIGVGLLTWDFDGIEAAFGDLVDSVKKTFSGLSDFVFGLWDGLAGGLAYVFKSYLPDTYSAIESFESAVISIFGRMGDLAGKAKDAVVRSVVAAFDRLSGFANDVGSALSKTIETASATISEISAGIVDSVAYWVASMRKGFEAIRAFFGDVLAAVEIRVSDFVGDVSGLIDGLMGPFRAVTRFIENAFSAVFGGATSDADAFAASAGGAMGNIENAVGGAMSGLVGVVGAKLAEAGKAAAEWAASLPAAIVEAFADLMGSLFGAVDGLVGGKLSEIGSMVSGWVDSLIGSISGLGSKIKDKVSSGLGSVAEFFGFGGKDDSESAGVLANAEPQTMRAAAVAAPSTYTTSTSSTTTINNSYSDTFNVRGWEDATRISSTRLERRRSGAQ